MNILESINLDLVGYGITVNTPRPTRVNLNQDRLVTLTGINVEPIGEAIKLTAKCNDKTLVCISKTSSECTLDGTVVNTSTCPRK